MEKDWAKVYGFKDMYLAEIAKQVLSDRNIPSIILNKQDSSYQTFGEIEIYVHRDNLIRAKALLKEIEH
ncbi:MAG: DUF2007 domain-containing protein [Bacteroidales bacterium]